LPPKIFELLLCLVQASPHLVMRDELMKSLWPDSFVEESNLTVYISILRKTLGQKPGGGDYIETVPRRGYRFRAQVIEIEESVEPAEPSPLRAQAQAAGALSAGAPAPSMARAPTAAESIPAPAPPPILPGAPGEPMLPLKAFRRRYWIAIFVGVLLGIVAGALFHRIHQPSLTAASAPRHSLAVLPFRNVRPDANTDFLGFSLADAVITLLGYVSAINVRPSSAVTSYRNQDVDLHKVGADLKVDRLLTGNYIKDGDDLRLNTQLIDLPSENILWRDTVNVKYENLLTVQDSVTEQLIADLAITLSPSETERLKQPQKVDPTAYEYYLRGVDLYATNDFNGAIQMLVRSASIDPSYAHTWARLGRAYTTEASIQFGGRAQYRLAQQAYQKALALDPGLIEGRIYMANLFTDTGRVEESVKLLRDVLRTNANNAEAHWELGYAYRFAGMLPESVTEGERARQLDPNVKINSSAMNSYLYLGEYDKFLQTLPASDSGYILFYRGLGEYYRRNFRLAQNYFDLAYSQHPTVVPVRIGKAFSDQIAHRNAEGIELLKQTSEMIEQSGVADGEAFYKLAQGFAVLGDNSAALRAFRQSVEHGFFCYPYFTADPLLDSLRGDPEFAQVVAQAQRRSDEFKANFSGREN
jgi:DNA-binding winged helix-turn-helix (wHTH) protein/TolB-like protein/Flp pilus assembly protein TadD